MSKRISILRLGFGHFISKWLLYPLCYHLVRYRRKMVRINLSIAFPDKDIHEIKRLERAFYLNFADMIMEVLVGWRFSEKVMRQFVVIDDLEEITDRCKRYGGGMVMLGHFLNWEWIVDYANQFAEYGVDCGSVYKRLNNNFFDRLMLKIRSHRGGFMVEMNSLLRVMVKRRNAKDMPPVCYAMLADQRPRRNAARYNTVFFNRQVGVLAGTEQLALRFKYPVYYIEMHSSRRGYYEVTPILIYDPEKDSDIQPGEITERFARMLEENIRQEPTRWLWTHRRFAGSKPVDE